MIQQKKYPIGIQNFEKIRREGYFYIDKTAIIHQLVQTGQYYFLSRPRRFGKSLLISTLEAYFEGKKELFDGLQMEQLEKEWKAYPVLHLDLNAEKYDTPDSLEAMLNDTLCSWEILYGTAPSETTLSLRFKGIIQRAEKQTGKQVVILIDEYDKPLLQTLGNEALQTDFRNTLKAFYGVLKTCDPYIRFALLTGVTRFSKVSISSDLNNLRDISMSATYGKLCGITQEELTQNLKAETEFMALKNNLSIEQTEEALKEWYNGYHFDQECTDIYNPFSLLNAFAEMKFGSYWFETGTPTFLVKLLKKSRYPLAELTGTMATSTSLGGIEAPEENPIPMLYQSGYLTIKSFDERFRTYTLGFPNREVADGFTHYLLPYYTAVRQAEAPMEIV